MVAAARRDERRAAGEDKARGAAHADDLRTGRKAEFASAVLARTKHQRHAGARGLVDRRLQHVGLVGAAAGAHAELRRVDAQGRQRCCRGWRREGRNRERAAQRGDGDQTATVDVHGSGPDGERPDSSRSRPAPMCWNCAGPAQSRLMRRRRLTVRACSEWEMSGTQKRSRRVPEADHAAALRAT